MPGSLFDGRGEITQPPYSSPATFHADREGGRANAVDRVLRAIAPTAVFAKHGRRVRPRPALSPWLNLSKTKRSAPMLSHSTDFWFVFAVLVLFNGATIKLLTLLLKDVTMSDAVREKGPQAALDAAGVAETSYSRIAGMIGAIVMATFFWAIANVIIYKALHNTTEIEKLITSISSFMLGGSSLFLPYAANQLRAAFKVG
jgi:hypothetical protein